LATVVASAGTLIVTTTTGLEKAAGYCDYTEDDSAEPTNCKLKASDHPEIGFIGTQAEINAALATLSFKGDGSTGSPSVTLSITLGGASYDSSTGHYYKAVAVADIDWNVARAAAKSDAQVFNGMRGYLANITTAAENTFITGKINKNAWIGGSDSGTEKIWKWMDGPEAGTAFTCQTSSGGAGATISGCTNQSYLNWDSGEPNQYNGNEEDFMHIYLGDPTASEYSKWNDFVIGNDAVDAYIIEYGGQGETVTVSGSTVFTIESLEASGNTHQAFNDKQLSGIVEAQTESVKRWMFNSTTSVLDRMEQFRRTGKNESIQLSDFKLALANQGVNNNTHAKLGKHYLQKYSKEFADKQGIDLTENNVEKFINELPLSKYMKKEFSLTPNKWAVWSIGSVSKGGLNFGVGQLGRKNQSNGFTVGADLDWSDNSLLGFALRDEVDNVDVSTNGTKFRSDNTSFSVYNTFKANEENFIDTFLSIGSTKQATTRIVDVANKTKVTGELKSKQAFGSLKYNFSKKFKIIKFDNYSRADFSYTMFDSYSEKGDNNLKLKFDDRDLKSSSVTVGSLIHADIGLRNSKFIPYLRVALSEDLATGSKLKANYISSSSSQYSKSINKNFSSIIRAETGFDWNFNSGWNISTTLDRIGKKGFGHQNHLKLNANKSF
jgi:uncharacterized protein YhjY with autotransporter beta-barrel domain